MMKVLACACALVALVSLDARAQTASSPSLAALSTQPSMNVFRRFAADRAKMIGFYGDVLGLKQLPSIKLGNGEMILFQIGTGQVKLQATAAASEYPSGPIREVSGLRVFTFFYPDEATVTARFVQHGYEAPRFQAARNGRRVAMVLDPENQWIELVIAPGAPPSTYDALEVGLTVTDLEKSRAFYREFVGLEELPPVDDPILGTTKYPFRHGTTTINVWSFGKPAKANTRSAGIQYVVSNVEAVDTKAKASGVKIDTPLGNFSAGLRTIWLSDPDGVTNYFAQIIRNSSSTK
ncbi:MAG TPA: VOC family protein [Vicinamibacterales bacterium]|jgi:catechol 2,3-dioxygenase-like lactoylglutathione lyase family enzyme